MSNPNIVLFHYQMIKEISSRWGFFIPLDSKIERPCGCNSENSLDNIYDDKKDPDNSILLGESYEIESF